MFDRGSDIFSEKPATHSGVAENRIEALKALATLLLREVESLEGAPSFDLFQTDAENICLYNEVQRFEIELIRHALIRARGNQRGAAALLGTKITTLHSKIKRYGVENFAAVGKL